MPIARWDESKEASDEVINEFAKNIRKSLDQELLYNLCIMSGYAGVTVEYKHLYEITEWVKQNATGEYRQFDNRFAFKESKDYEWFMLRWS
jgi:hypothetical protein